MRIALLLDGSPEALHGLPWALGQSPAELTLLQTGADQWEQLAGGYALDANHELSRLARALREQGIPCVARMTSGLKLPSLIRSLDEINPDLAVVATRPRPGWTRLLRQSISKGLAGTSPCPLLVVRPGEPVDDAELLRRRVRPGRALVALDGTEFAEAALGPARACLRERPARLVLLGASGEPPCDPDDPEKARRQADLTRLAGYLRQVASQQGEPDLECSWHTEDARAPEAILDWSEREQADLVALATHGRSGPARWLLGSVATSLLERSRRPLLLVTPRCVS